MPTLKDIAKLAGVNVSTISRALKDSPEINAETKRKILKIASELNYFSRKFSENVVSKSYTIGLIAPEIESNFYSQLVSTIEKRITAQGYSLITGFTNFEYEEEVRFLNIFAHRGVDGIVLIRSLDARTIEDLRTFKTSYDIPVILVETKHELEIYDCLKIDDYLGVSMAVEHLAELGHTHIGYIGDTLSAHRKAPFVDTLQKHGIKVNDNLVRIGEDRFEEGGYKRMNELLSQKKVPTAVFASYDSIAIGAMKAIFDKGLRIPEDISIISIDNIKVSGYLYKALSTVSVPVNNLGDISTRILFSKINDKTSEVVQHVVLKPQLMVRETTAAPRDNAD